jgi:hypothetical protein
MNIAYPKKILLLLPRHAVASKEIGSRRHYAFSEDFLSLCMDKKHIIQAENEACERLLKYARNGSEKAVIEKEIAEVKIALDLMP